MSDDRCANLTPLVRGRIDYNSMDHEFVVDVMKLYFKAVLLLGYNNLFNHEILKQKPRKALLCFPVHFSEI